MLEVGVADETLFTRYNQTQLLDRYEAGQVQTYIREGAAGVVPKLQEENVEGG